MTKNFREKRIFLLTVGTVLIGMIALFWQISSTVSQTKPLTIAQIYTFLNSGKDENGKKWTIAERNKRAVRDVKKVGVNFALTADNESGLREAGATNELIEAIRQNSPTIKPTQTPIIKPTQTTGGREIKNSIGIEFVRISAGTFMMGSPTSEKDRDADETQHKVTISKDFYLGKYEVTQGQWKAVMGNNPSRFSSCGDDCPVEQVSWDDVQEFIKKLNAKDSGTYRLPTEAEWEYAARAGTTTPFGIGDGNNLSSSQANFDGNYPYGNAAKGKYLEKTVSVGSYSPNAWGLYDMHGNVWEWCADWYGAYSSSAQTDPTGASSGSIRVIRGGSWFNNGRDLRSAYRYYDYAPSVRFNIIGFRLLRMQ